MHYQQEYIRCGRNCKKCPHGPYWYGYWRDKKRLHKKYFGKFRPPGVGPDSESVHKNKNERGQADPLPKNNRFDEVFSRRTCTESLCLEILGLRSSSSWASIQAAYRQLVAKHHPDRGGSTVACQRVVAAFTFLKSRR